MLNLINLVEFPLFSLLLHAFLAFAVFLLVLRVIFKNVPKLFYSPRPGKRFMGQVRYACEGTCGGSVSEEEYNSGKNVCGMEDCPKHGQPLVRKEE